MVLGHGQLSHAINDAVDDPWVWLVIYRGRIVAGGSEVCSSIAHECAVRAWNRWCERGGLNHG